MLVSFVEYLLLLWIISCYIILWNLIGEFCSLSISYLRDLFIKMIYQFWDGTRWHDMTDCLAVLGQCSALLNFGIVFFRC